jgi:cytochrome c553
MIRRTAWLASSLSFALLAPQMVNAAGDPVRGAKVAYTCHGCHGIPNYRNAYPVYPVPKHGAQHTGYRVSALKAYQSGERQHATMHAQATTLSDQDFADVAVFLAGQQLKSTGKPTGTAPKSSQTCVACHGTDGVGIMPDYPNLAGQQEDYIVQALHEYKSGTRKNPIMAGMAAPLKDADIRELAQYYAAQRPSLCATDEIREHGKCKGL